MKEGTCRRCNKPVPIRATECPECGYDPRRTFGLAGVGVVLVGLFLVPVAGDWIAALSVVGVAILAAAVFWVDPTK